LPLQKIKKNTKVCTMMSLTNASWWMLPLDQQHKTRLPKIRTMLWSSFFNAGLQRRALFNNARPKFSLGGRVDLPSILGVVSRVFRFDGTCIWTIGRHLKI
jgi:hypothetical protein